MIHKIELYLNLFSLRNLRNFTVDPTTIFKPIHSGGVVVIQS